MDDGSEDDDDSDDDYDDNEEDGDPDFIAMSLHADHSQHSQCF